MSTEHLLQQKILALWDFGSVVMVRPTGRYVQTNYGDLLEVKRGLFGSKNWVSPKVLTVIKTKETA